MCARDDRACISNTNPVGLHTRAVLSRETDTTAPSANVATALTSAVWPDNTVLNLYGGSLSIADAAQDLPRPAVKKSTSISRDYATHAPYINLTARSCAAMTDAIPAAHAPCTAHVSAYVRLHSCTPSCPRLEYFRAERSARNPKPSFFAIRYLERDII